MTVILEVAVGEAPGQVGLAETSTLVAAAAEAGVAGIRLVDQTDGGQTVDPSTLAGFLAGEIGDITYVVDAPTTHNAPYNLARRVLSLDRATGGRVGLALRVGDGDEVSDAVEFDDPGTDPAERWSEYAQIVTGLWESFPAQALIGDREAGIVADDTLITPIDHDGRFYRVAGPLDGPTSPQVRPPVIVADVDELGWNRIAAVADAVIIEHRDLTGADLDLSEALTDAGRDRRDVALLARLHVDDADPLLQALASTTVDGIILVHGGDLTETVEVVRNVVPRCGHRPPDTLREALGLAPLDAALAPTAAAGGPTSSDKTGTDR